MPSESHIFMENAIERDRWFVVSSYSQQRHETATYRTLLNKSRPPFGSER